MSRAEKRKYHYIYKITCKITNRFYIGMHSTDNLDDRYFGSGKRLWNSINYHGKKNHIKEILEFLPSRQSLKEREKEIVNKELISENLCMNLQEGGGGGFSSEKHKAKFLTDGVKNGRQICDEKLKEKYGDNHLSIISKIHFDKINNDTVEKEKWKGQIKTGLIKAGYEFGTFFGKQHSDETKQKMSESLKGMGKGETNSQYGTCWVTKDGLTKKVKKENLETYLKEGWVKGRK